MAADLTAPPRSSRPPIRDLFLKAQAQSGQKVSTVSSESVRQKVESDQDPNFTGSEEDRKLALEFINAQRAQNGASPLTSLNGAVSQETQLSQKAGRKKKASTPVPVLQIQSDSHPADFLPEPSALAPHPEVRVEFVLPMGTFASKVSAIEVGAGSQVLSIWYPVGMDSLFRPAAQVELEVRCMGASYAVISSGIHIESETFNCGVSIFFIKPTPVSE